MRLLESDLLTLFEANARGLVPSDIQWGVGCAANIVLASGGYPDAYRKGLPIAGLDEASAVEGVVGPGAASI